MVIKKNFGASIIKNEKPIITRSKLNIRRIKEITQLLARKRGIKRYKSMPEDKLLDAIILSKPVKKSKKSKF